MQVKLLLSANQKTELYVQAVEGCGAQAVARYCPDDSPEDYDGLILCGGNDINPAYYQAELNGSLNIDDARDESEFALLHAFLQAKKPVLGICRGFQLLNVAFGGSLIQHLDTVELHRKSTPPELVHDVVAEKGSYFERTYGERFSVNSYHHQGLDAIGEGLRVTLRSPIDGIAEGFEHESLPCFGVQWHPERTCFAQSRPDAVDGSPIFYHFIELCKRHA